MLVKDIRPYDSSHPTNFVALGKKLLFTANDGVHGTELWTSDGTAAGTRILKDIAPGEGCTEISDFTTVGTELYFIAHADNQARIWKTDGTPANTRPLGSKRFHSPTGLTILGKLLFFTAIEFSTEKWKLWKSDGTAAGTGKVLNMSLGDWDAPEVMRTGSRVVFTVTSAWSHIELWSTNGTAEKTVKICDADFLRSFGNYTAPGESKPSLYFSGLDSAHGVELWKSDGTAKGTGLFKDLSPGSGHSFPGSFTVVRDRMFFSAAQNGEEGNILWVSKGTAKSTKPIKKFARQISPQSEFGDLLLFKADDGISGTEIWKSNGSATGTVPLTDFMGTGDSSYFSFERVDGNKLRFWANTGDSYLEILHETDGTAAGTKAFPHLRGDCVAGGTIFFQGIHKISDYNWDFELYKSDGTEAGTKMVKNILAGGSSYPADFNALGNIVCFTADDGVNGRELWRSDGQAVGTFMLKDLVPGLPGSTPGNFIRVGNILYFMLPSAEYPRQLWRTDGTASGTFMLVESEYLQDLTAFGDTLFFTIKSEYWAGRVLWRSDGSLEGTFRIDTAPVDTIPISGGLYYFLRSAESGAAVDLWRSDGTAAGTYKVSRQSGSLSDRTPGVVLVGSRVSFWITKDNRNELWLSDGTGLGTTKVGAMGDQISGIYSQVVAGNTLFFLTSESHKNHKLWKSDGTPQGTGPVLCNIPWDYYSSLWVAGNNLYFPFKSEKYGTELHALSIGDLRTARDGFNAWSGIHSLTEELAAPLSIPFSDGVENLLKYAFFMNGSRADRHTMSPGSGLDGLPAVSTIVNSAGSKVLRVEFIRRKNSGLVYRAQFSNSLATGTFLPITEPPFVTSVDAERERVVVEHKVDPVSSGSCFGRVVVSME